jgi:beta-1,4-mannosyl-glycoprotein beta-1,4-N-acetylglucosaminyltransferase
MNSYSTYFLGRKHTRIKSLLKPAQSTKSLPKPIQSQKKRPKTETHLKPAYLSIDETKKNIKIIDCFTFYNDVDLFIYRLNLLYDIVDYFIIVEASLADSCNGQKMCFKENEKLFEKFKDKIIHIVIDNANIDISKNQQFVNEKMQRNNISHGIDKVSLNNDDVIIISNLDEIPDPNLLLSIKNGKISIEFNCLEQDFYYYNLNNKMRSKWYYSKIISYKKYKEINKTCDDIRHTSCSPILKAGWHLSYFGSTEFIKNKNQEFSHQEYNKPEFLDLSVINDKIIDGKDLFNHQNDEAEKIAICDNTYLPPLYEKYLSNFFKFENICFIHSCNLELTGTKRLEYLVSEINKSGAVKIFDKIIINNIGIPIENTFGEKYEVINYSKNSLLHEIPTLNKLKHLSESIYNIKILYLHTKGITHEKSNYAVKFCVYEWIDMMLYFLVEKHQECISKLNSGYDSVGCNYLEACISYPTHYSGNFWWANSKHIKNLPFIEENNTNKYDAEFWLFKNKHDYFTIHNSNVNHYLIRYPPNKYIE